MAWVALSQTLGRDLGFRDLLWCGLAVASAAIVNLGRLSFMAIWFDQFDTIYGQIGSQIAWRLTLILILIICMVGQRRELFTRR